MAFIGVDDVSFWRTPQHLLSSYPTYVGEPVCHPRVGGALVFSSADTRSSRRSLNLGQHEHKRKRFGSNLDQNSGIQTKRTPSTVQPASQISRIAESYSVGVQALASGEFDKAAKLFTHGPQRVMTRMCDIKRPLIERGCLERSKLRDGEDLQGARTHFRGAHWFSDAVKLGLKIQRKAKSRVNVAPRNATRRPAQQAR